jgi:NADPH:quinone reductase-like Zn-dependent oxidoreductase
LPPSKGSLAVPPKSLKLSPLIVAGTLLLIVASMYWARPVLIPVAQRSFAVLKPGGRGAFIASGAQAPKPDRPDVTALRPKVARSRAPLERIVELVTSGVVRPPPIKLYRLSQAIEAHRLSESRHFRGKLVLQVR